MAILSTSRLIAVGVMVVAALTACSTTVKGHSLGTDSAAATNSGDISGDAHSTAASRSTATSSAASSKSSRTKPSVTAGPDGAPHPCALLTQSEAEALAGTPLAAGIESGQGDDKTLCQYVGPTTGPLAQVQLLVGDGAKKTLDIDRDILEHSFTTLSGVGDEAYQEDDNVFLRKGDTWVSINLSRLNEPDENVDRMKTAAREIADRLG